MNSSLDICNYLKWEQVPEDIKSAIHEELDGQYWGKKEWMDLGWRLWVGTIDQKLAVLSWTREAGQCEDFFFPLSDGCVLIWQTITVPRYRGKALAPFMYKKCSENYSNGKILRVYVLQRVQFGIEEKTLRRSGFKYIGFGVRKRRRTGYLVSRYKRSLRADEFDYGFIARHGVTVPIYLLVVSLACHLLSGFVALMAARKVVCGSMV
jgi:hypothetical protein